MSAPDGTFRLGYDLSQLEKDGHRAGLIARQTAAEVARHHAEAAKVSSEHWAKVRERLGVSEVVGRIGAALTVGAAVEGAHRLIESYAHLADISQRFEASPESMQRLEYHAKMAGSNIDSASDAVGKLAVKLEQTDDPGVVKALRELRLEAVALAGESPERQFEILAAAFNAANREGRGLSATRELLGRGFQELLPMIREWDEISRHKIEVVSDADVKRLKEADDTITRFMREVKVKAANVITSEFGTGAVKDLMREAKELLERGDGAGKRTGSWMDAARDALSGAPAEAKRFNTKAASLERQERAASEKTAKAISEALVEEMKLREDLAKEKQSAMEAEFNDGEKIESATSRILELEMQIKYARENGPLRVGELLKMEIEREKIARALNEAAVREGEAKQREIEQDRQLAQEELNRHIMAQQRVKKNVEARGDALAELGILEARAHGHGRLADKMQKQVDIEKEKRRFVDLGMDPVEAQKMATRMWDARDRQNNPHKIHGYDAHSPHKFGGYDPTSFHSLTAMAHRQNTKLRDEFHFPALDEMNRTMKEVVDLLKEK